MKKLIVSILIAIPLFSNAQTSLKGTIVDAETKTPLAGASIKIIGSYRVIVSDFDGSFIIESKQNELSLAISFIGYSSDTVLVKSSNNNLYIELQAFAFPNEEVIILATRTNQEASGSVSNLSKTEIEENNLGQDLPYVIQNTPSVISTSDAGNGVGYTGIRIRGSDASRINVTVNGIPLNDPESHGVFWVNMPDFSSSLNSIQIQRGLGSSTNGAGAFGASVNLETNQLSDKAFAEINNSYGSFNTLKHTVKVGSGLINQHFAFEGRLSKIASDGYLDRANADLKSYYLSGAYYGKKTIIKVLAFGGIEKTRQAWWGTPEARFNNDIEGMQAHADNNYLSDDDRKNLLESGRTYNYYRYKNQIDHYQQDHFQLHLSHVFSEKLTANLSLHYTKGKGYYEEFKSQAKLSDYLLNPVVLFGAYTVFRSDLVRRRWLDNDFYGLTYSLIARPSHKLKFILGGGLNNYEGKHFGQVIWAQYASNGFLDKNYYSNRGEKLDGNSFLKTSLQLNQKLSAFVDLQFRHIAYKVKGFDNDQRELNVSQQYNFFNPKIGLNYNLNKQTELYGFFAIGNREPNRADFVDQALNTPVEKANTSELMRDLELGLNHQANKYSLSFNAYFMDYDNQLVATGQLNDVGAPLRQNVAKSFRAGIELQTSVLLSKKIEWKANLNLSQNKIKNFDELIYDFSGEVAERNAMKNTNIALSPEIIANSLLSFQVRKQVNFTLISRYIGKQYLDNTQNENRKLKPYFVNDVRLSVKIPSKSIKQIHLLAQVNNVFSTNYASNGYTYSYYYEGVVTENFVYPQAFRNFMLGLNVRF